MTDFSAHDAVVLSEREFHEAFEKLVENGLRLPHDVMPGIVEGHRRGEWDAAAWADYPWNPPAGYEGSDRDPQASPKVRWWGIVEMHLMLRRARLLGQARARLSLETQRRIARVFVPDEDHPSLAQESYSRLSGGNTPERLAERERLLWRYQDLKEALDGMSAAELSEFDPSADTHWTDG